MSLISGYPVVYFRSFFHVKNSSDTVALKLVNRFISTPGIELAPITEDDFRAEYPALIIKEKLNTLIGNILNTNHPKHLKEEALGRIYFLLWTITAELSSNREDLLGISGSIITSCTMWIAAAIIPIAIFLGLNFLAGYPAHPIAFPAILALIAGIIAVSNSIEFVKIYREGTSSLAEMFFDSAKIVTSLALTAALTTFVVIFYVSPDRLFTAGVTLASIFGGLAVLEFLELGLRWYFQKKEVHGGSFGTIPDVLAEDALAKTARKSSVHVNNGLTSPTLSTVPDYRLKGTDPNAQQYTNTTKI